MTRKVTTTTDQNGHKVTVTQEVSTSFSRTISKGWGLLLALFVFIFPSTQSLTTAIVCYVVLFVLFGFGFYAKAQQTKKASHNSQQK